MSRLRSKVKLVAEVKEEPDLSIKLEEQEVPPVKIESEANSLQSEHLSALTEKTASVAKSTFKKPSSSNNIIKNYSRALTNFALSKVGRPYLNLMLQEAGIDFKFFSRFVRKNRQKINCIQSLRNKLLILENDPEKIIACKQTFQKISEVFLKYFSVNWIFSSKVCDKMTHVKYRFKILRRVRNPEYFTYLEGFKNTNGF